MHAGEMTNIQSRTSDPEDPRLMKLVEKKHRQEMKMARTLSMSCAPPPPFLELHYHLLCCGAMHDHSEAHRWALWPDSWAEAAWSARLLSY
jgi:hypothetical protein